MSSLDLKTVTELLLRSVFGRAFQISGAEHLKVCFAKSVNQSLPVVQPLVLASENWCKGINTSFIGVTVVDEETMRRGHRLSLVH